MRTIAFGLIVAVAGMLAISTSDAATGTCQANCVAVERIGDKLLTVWYDAKGVAQDAITVDLPRDARRLSGEKGVGSGYVSPETLNEQQSTQDGGTVEVSQTTYQTTTHIVVVITTTYRDANGNIIDVQVTVLRFEIPGVLD